MKVSFAACLLRYVFAREISSPQGNGHILSHAITFFTPADDPLSCLKCAWVAKRELKEEKWLRSEGA